MRTPYSIKNQDKSDRAHVLAQTTIYPYFFQTSTENIEFETTNVSQGGMAAILDGEMGIDRIVYLNTERLKQPLKISVQERFCDSSFIFYHALTITEWNHNSNRASELYNICSGVFVFGYPNEECTDFIEAVMVDTAKLLIKLAMGEISYKTRLNRRSNQSFITIDIDELIHSGVVLSHYDKRKDANPQTTLAV